MGRYRKVDVRVWSDASFRGLSSAPANGQTLWLYLMTGPHPGVIPGVFKGRASGMAEDLGWSRESFLESFGESSRKGMAKADWGAGLVWLPNALKHNRPHNPNVVKGWKNTWEELPECSLKNEIHSAIWEHFETLPESYRKSLRESLGEPLGEPARKQEQEQEQDLRSPPVSPPQNKIPPVDEGRKSPAPAPVEPVPLPPLDDHDARVATAIGEFGRRYQRARGMPWGGAGAAHRDMSSLVAWCRELGGDDWRQECTRALDGFFADDWARSKDFPPRALAKSPAKYHTPPKPMREPGSRHGESPSYHGTYRPFSVPEFDQSEGIPQVQTKEGK